MFFVSQRETWKHFGHVILAGYLVFTGLLYFGIDEFYGTSVVSIMTAIFALLAGVSFFLRTRNSTAGRSESQ